MPARTRDHARLGGPLGAHWSAERTTFSLVSRNATAVVLCLGNAAPRAGEERLPMERIGGELWRVDVAGLRPGQGYGFRVEGPYRPSAGHRFNPNKLLLDPRARAITRSRRWHDDLLGVLPGREDDGGGISTADSASHAPRSVVVDPRYDWGDDVPPRTPWDRTLIYECHVKGMTARHPDVPPAWRGRYRGLASEPVLDHLRRLGVTAVELMPVHHSFSEPHLARRRRVNYWGYSSVGYFAPDARFASADRGQQVREFRDMVVALHRAGIEVLLDVVFNHTAEGDAGGPTLCFRGIDNALYYRLDAAQPERYVDTTGCGNTLAVERPRVLELVLDSLRWWVQEMHVDGFRFDLAPSLGRDDGEFRADAALFRAIAAEPALAGVKLIAEPWDLGPDGYQLGAFPAPWGEWNGRYRDCIRRFWRGDPGTLAELAARLSGSSDTFSAARGPLASINFVASHDGFTLRDLVTYRERRNHANGHDNLDGHHDDFSDNQGHEGETDDPDVVARRRTMQRNMLATLALSLGVPMLSHGDEIGRTQRGNNNPYGLDGPVTWMDWRLDGERTELLAFVRRLLELRRGLPELSRSRFFTGVAPSEDGEPDVRWLRPDGAEMTTGDWQQPDARTLGMWLAGSGSRPSLLVLLSASAEKCRFALPSDVGWRVLLWTSAGEPDAAGAEIALPPRSLLVLRAAGGPR